LWRFLTGCLVNQFFNLISSALAGFDRNFRETLMSTVIRWRFIKIRHNPAIRSQPFGQKLGASKPGFYGA
jgi:hypothetical protein